MKSAGNPQVARFLAEDFSRLVGYRKYPRFRHYRGRKVSLH